MKLYKNKEYLEEQYLVNKKSIQIIAKELGVSSFTISKYIKDFNIPLRPRTNGLKGHHHTKETKQKMGNSRKKYLLDHPEAAEKFAALNTLNIGKPRTKEVREKISKTHLLLNFHQTEEAKQQISKSLIEYRKLHVHPCKGRKQSEEHIEKNRIANKGRQLSEEHKKKIGESHRGEKSVNWKGGKSKFPYCHLWTPELKEKIRNDYNRKCFLCGKSEIENGEKLSVHHIYYNKMQGCGKRSWNLVSLCRKCHAKMSHNQWYWFSILYNRWSMNTNIIINIIGEFYA